MVPAESFVVAEEGRKILRMLDPEPVVPVRVYGHGQKAAAAADVVSWSC